MGAISRVEGKREIFLTRSHCWKISTGSADQYYLHDCAFPVKYDNTAGLCLRSHRAKKRVASIGFLWIFWHNLKSHVQKRLGGYPEVLYNEMFFFLNQHFPRISLLKVKFHTFENKKSYKMVSWLKLFVKIFL